ncbi:MAG: hypothetical protein ACD_70C00027G0005 [uncultured bacterium]|nr:MAG: hypothetical protein ACD_70C00027G0005 [uncultured bacterium]OGT25535.1 MAG: CopG family transcriptional regulator [Gammaproteobacteria bacterium RIFCSPHIGHO2_02_FULL_42_43]OGT28448.1 MAG: CopG family transcriptional regulator [Gammaproteobacteria bacterium RIFCSPHIGHO2_01_FULL_42_8]OGT51489.1 MAG: CopG family transcriptional regulator [Gammaproteobacteria bacterium RIFCSPHIGHO2_12_FULL_41_25]OGT62190.1 MAG: CopG family transcriptional regulator [Gammaproteobacteria bacterium RIFCSPLOWO
MKKRKVKYTDEALGNLEVVEDFLPKPEDLILKEETIKVTLSLTKDSVDYFKSQASERHTQYQKMIRILLDKYVARFSGPRKTTHFKKNVTRRAERLSEKS